MRGTPDRTIGAYFYFCSSPVCFFLFFFAWNGSPAGTHSVCRSLVVPFVVFLAYWRHVTIDLCRIECRGFTSRRFNRLLTYHGHASPRWPCPCLLPWLAFASCLPLLPSLAIGLFCCVITFCFVLLIKVCQWYSYVHKWFAGAKGWHG